jgi:AraC-like DNA-binding protein
VARVERAPALALSAAVPTTYVGFRETTETPVVRREGPGAHVVLLVSFEEDWLIDGTRVQSFVAGLHGRQVTTEHGGRSFGLHVNLSPPAAHRILRVPLDTLAHRAVPLTDVLDEPSLVERLQQAGDWDARFAILDAVLARRLAEARPVSVEVTWAWERLVESGGRVAVGSLAEELGWSRKRIVAHFREQIGLAPKAAARLLRFERARALAEAGAQPDWGRIAVDCGYYDQSHLINDFRSVTGRTPETFFQDGTAETA